MRILTINNFDNIIQAEVSMTIAGKQDEYKKKLHSRLTELGIPESDLNDSPLVRYCRYLHSELGLTFQQPNNELVNDVLFDKCGSKVIWALA